VKLMSNLSIIVRGSHLYSSRRLADYDLNAAEQYILMYLMGQREANQESIAKFYMLDKSTVARSLAKLENKGYITRRVNDDNQREKMITLTDRARSLKEVLSGLLDEWRGTMYDGISDEEVRAFEKIVEKISDNVAKTL